MSDSYFFILLRYLNIIIVSCINFGYDLDIMWTSFFITPFLLNFYLCNINLLHKWIDILAEFQWLWTFTWQKYSNNKFFIFYYFCFKSVYCIFRLKYNRLVRMMHVFFYFRYLYCLIIVKLVRGKTSKVIAFFSKIKFKKTLKIQWK
jgi:hypothetical protein